MSAWTIPLFDARFGPEEEAAVLRPLRAGWLTMGEEVLRLEEELCAASGAHYAVAVSNCTVALQLACVALGIGRGHEVICPTLTFVATANAPVTLGARVRFCEAIGPDDLTVDPESVMRQLSPNSKAIMLVHYAGFACRMETLLRVARERNIAVIEDCAHALFTFHEGKALGLYGKVGCFSFFSNKNITCGEGGALVTDDEGLAGELRLLRSHGMTSLTLERHKGHAHSYDVLMPGYNCRLDEIRAALLRAQLRQLPGFLRKRRELFYRYVEGLRGSPVEIPFQERGAEIDQTAVHLMPVLLPAESDRTAVMDRLRDARIQTSIHYPPVHAFTAYRRQAQTLPRTEALARRQLTLPLYPTMRPADVDLVVHSLLKSLSE